jgi:hypothetical protein
MLTDNMVGSQKPHVVRARMWRSGGGLVGGSARMSVGSHPHLLVVGAGNPIAVPSLTRLGATRSDYGSCDPRDQQMSKSPSWRAFLIFICELSPRSPARLVRYYYSRLDTSRILSCLRAGHVSHELFWRRGGYGRIHVVGERWSRRQAIGKQRHGMMLQACGTRVSFGDEARRYAGRGRVAAGGATRSGGGGPMDRPPQVKAGTETFRFNIFVPQRLEQTTHRGNKRHNNFHISTQIKAHTKYKTCELHEFDGVVLLVWTMCIMRGWIKRLTA